MIKLSIFSKTSQIIKLSISSIQKEKRKKYTFEITKFSIFPIQKQNKERKIEKKGTFERSPPPPPLPLLSRRRKRRLEKGRLIYGGYRVTITNTVSEAAGEKGREKVREASTKG